MIVVKEALPWTSIDEVCDVLALVVWITVNCLIVVAVVNITDVDDFFSEMNWMHISSIIDVKKHIIKNNNWNIHTSRNSMHKYNEDWIKDFKI